jgi:hypothetical protein
MGPQPRAPRTNADALAFANPVDSSPFFAIGDRDLDIASETNEIIELQLLRHHPYGLWSPNPRSTTIKTLVPPGSISASHRRLVFVVVTVVFQGILVNG